MLIGVTGATGFVGRSLVRHLLEANHQVRAWYRPGSDRSNMPEIDWLPGELGDEQATKDLVQGADAIIHAAVNWAGPGNRHRENKDDEVLAFLRSNLMGSLELMQRAYSVGVPRFIFVSSCAVHEVILKDRPLDETHPLWATSHYGAYKGAVEKFVHSYGLGKGWGICSLRPTGIYGLAHPSSTSRWYDLVGQVLRGDPVNTARGGKEVQVDDVARAIVLLLQVDARQISGQAFNCYDRYIAEQEVARIAVELTGSKSIVADVNRGPKNQIVADKIKRLGMVFGGDARLKKTVQELIDAHRS